MRRVFSFGVLAAMATAIGVVPATAQQQVRAVGSATVYTPSAQLSAASSIDYVNAKPMPLPQNQFVGSGVAASVAAPAALGAPSFHSGAEGNGAQTPQFLGAPAANLDDSVGSQEHGTYSHPFSTARSDLRTAGAGVPTNTYYPYRASGKLFFNIGAGTYVCSASLIKTGLVVTAAHCVAEYGDSTFHTNHQFVPGYRNGSAPYGVWTAYQLWVKTAYYNGSGAPCAVYGVVCPHDIAVMSLNAQSGTFPGAATGYYGYGYDGYGFVGGLTQVTQVGYPVCLDNGVLQQRNDSYGYTDGSLNNNTVIGSLMCGGSSGGPWLTTFGIRPTLTGTTSGSAASSNIVVGVTSWGYTSTAPKEQGASPFTASNIQSLVNSACTAAPAGTCS